MPWKLLNCITDISHISFNSAIWVELLKTRAYMDKSKAASSAATFNNHKTIVFTPLLNKRAMPWTTTPVGEDNFPAATLFPLLQICMCQLHVSFDTLWDTLRVSFLHFRLISVLSSSRDAPIPLTYSPSPLSAAHARPNDLGAGQPPTGHSSHW